MIGYLGYYHTSTISPCNRLIKDTEKEQTSESKEHGKIYLSTPSFYSFLFLCFRQELSEIASKGNNELPPRRSFSIMKMCVRCIQQKQVLTKYMQEPSQEQIRVSSKHLCKAPMVMVGRLDCRWPTRVCVSAAAHQKIQN